MGISKGYVFESPVTCTGSRIPKANVLINNDGHACISDFSLITIVSDPQTFLSTCMEGGTIPWMSPELLDPGSFGLEKSYLTKESDYYALGMVIYEVLSGLMPFAPWGVHRIIQKVLKGERPGRPRGEGGALFTDDIWKTLELCWKHKPSKRANAKAVLRCLGGTLLPSRPPGVNGAVETDADELSDATSSDSGMSFSVPPGIATLPPILLGVTDSQVARREDGLSVPPQKGGSKRRWVGVLARNARKPFKAVA